MTFKIDKKKYLNRLNNLSLKTKILFIVIAVACLILTASLIGIRMVSAANNRLLYETLAGSLSYSAKDISKNLHTIEDMTTIMIADEDIQNNLSIVADSQNLTKRNTAYTVLSYNIPDYYLNYRNSCLYYLNLYNPSYTIYSYKSRTDQVPDSVIEDCLVTAQENPGYPCWITKYGNEHGIFLTRTVRRASQLGLDYLGTILAAIDPAELIDTATSSVVNGKDVGYLLMDNGAEIYRSGSLMNESLPSSVLNSEDNYGVIHLNGSPRFYIRGQIPDFGWDYFCVVDYSSIAGTQRNALYLCLLVIAFVTVAGFMLSRRFITALTDHIHDLIWKINQFGKDESILPRTDYDYTSRQDEIGQLHQQFDAMTIKIQDLIRENYVKEILANEAKLKALENQINPHFLYNTLYAVYWRAKQSGETTIATMVESLSSLLRATLSKGNGSSTLKRELDVVHSYMTIQKFRFEDRLQYSDDIPETLLNLGLPQLTLQPLVENAISYGLEETSDTCYIQIRGYRTDTEIRIEVSNSGSQFEENLLRKLETNEIKPRGLGIGLLNIHRRLGLVYGDEYGLLLFNSDEDHAVARIHIPLQNTDTHN